MAVLLFAEISNGSFRKNIFEAATFASDVAAAQGLPVCAVVVGSADAPEIQKLGTYGVGKVLHIQDPRMDAFANMAFASAIATASKHCNARFVVSAQTYNARAVMPRVAVKLDGTIINGITGFSFEGATFSATRPAYSGKGIEQVTAQHFPLVLTVKTNAYGVREKHTQVEVESLAFSPGGNDFAAIAKEIVKVSSKISLTEADVVVSAGRGMKGPENWKMIEDLAELLGAATACSKPVADMDWRPHHEHVGQTGIQIAPNLYIAIGISGAIQHLAGVNSSKVIVVINKDPEAPFFKIADYGIVGDLFEVVPKLVEAVRKLNVHA